MNTKLIVSCIGGTGALGGVTGGCYYLLSNKETNDTPSKQDQPSREESTVSTTKQTLKEALKGEGFEALDLVGTSDKDSWKKLIAKYNATETKIQVEGNIEKGANDDDSANIKKLQTACKKLLDKTDNISDNDKTIAKNWCNKNSNLIKEGGA